MARQLTEGSPNQSLSQVTLTPQSPPGSQNRSRSAFAIAGRVSPTQRSWSSTLGRSTRGSVSDVVQRSYRSPPLTPKQDSHLSRASLRDQLKKMHDGGGLAVDENAMAVDDVWPGETSKPTDAGGKLYPLATVPPPEVGPPDESLVYGEEEQYLEMGQQEPYVGQSTLGGVGGSSRHTQQGWDTSAGPYDDPDGAGSSGIQRSAAPNISRRVLQAQSSVVEHPDGMFQDRNEFEAGEGGAEDDDSEIEKEVQSKETSDDETDDDKPDDETDDETDDDKPDDETDDETDDRRWGFGAMRQEAPDTVGDDAMQEGEYTPTSTILTHSHPGVRHRNPPSHRTSEGAPLELGHPPQRRVEDTCLLHLRPSNPCAEDRDHESSPE